MRKIAVVTAAVLVLGAMGVATASRFGAGPETITGTEAGERLAGGVSPDVIYGLGGDDIIWGNKAPDRLYGGRGNDRLNGYGSGEAHDLLNGGPGWDICTGTRHDTFVSCEVVKVRKGLGKQG